MSNATTANTVWNTLPSTSGYSVTLPNPFQPTLGKLAEALSKAQSRIQGALKDAENPHFKSNYADLESTWNACRQQLADNGLAITQTMHKVDGERILRTTLLHISGESISGDTPILLGTRQDMQALGSAITYARRYGLASMVGVAPKDDDDGEAAVGRGGPAVKSPPTAPKTAQEAPEQSKRTGFRKSKIEENNGKTTESKETKSAEEEIWG